VGPLAAKFVRDFTGRTVFGPWWLILRAVIPTLGLIAILQHVEALRQPGLPYGLYVISGMVLWASVGIALTKGTRSMAQAAALCRHFYFPRIVVPLAANAVPLIYHLVFLVFLAGAIGWYALFQGVLYLRIGPELLWAPAMIVLNFLLIAGIVSFLSVTFMLARDVRFMIPMVSQLWFLATPIIYTADLLSPQWRAVMFCINPEASIVETLRWSLFGVGHFEPLYVITAVLEVLLTLLAGAWFTMRSERILKVVL
jgi:lipopolysaccharide transport system permease protein